MFLSSSSRLSISVTCSYRLLLVLVLLRLLRLLLVLLPLLSTAGAAVGVWCSRLRRR